MNGKICTLGRVWESTDPTWNIISVRHSCWSQTSEFVAGPVKSHTSLVRPTSAFSGRITVRSSKLSMSHQWNMLWTTNVFKSLVLRTSANVYRVVNTECNMYQVTMRTFTRWELLGKGVFWTWRVWALGFEEFMHWHNIGVLDHFQCPHRISFALKAGINAIATDETHFNV